MDIHCESITNWILESLDHGAPQDIEVNNILVSDLSAIEIETDEGAFIVSVRRKHDNED
jgi:hypothetical protein